MSSPLHLTPQDTPPPPSRQPHPTPMPGGLIALLWYYPSD